MESRLLFKKISTLNFLFRSFVEEGEVHTPISKRLWFICVKICLLCFLGFIALFALTIQPGFQITKALLEKENCTLAELWKNYKFPFLVVSCSFIVFFYKPISRSAHQTPNFTNPK
jgi:hypothetical protein